jgi:7,8-dihydroneopterin aldolase/epimerase/oxygenase
MNDQISICDLEVHYRVGVPDEERAAPQRLLLSIDMGLDFGPAAATDDLRHTVDYAAVCARLKAWGAEREWRLIEKLAADVAALLLAEHPVAWVRVHLKKFILPETRWVGVRVERRAASGS